MSDDTTNDDTTNDETSEEGRAEVPGDHNLFVNDDHGDGRPVVLIHGWPLSSESWSAQLAPLREAGYRVVAYDRRGFGKSNPGDSYGYDALADDLDNVMSDLDLDDVTLVGFSMGGGEVARYASRHGLERVRSVVLAAAVPPFMLQSDDNPDGPLTEQAAGEMRSGLEGDRDAFFDDFTTQFFTAGGDLKVSEDQRQEALTLCKQSDQEAALSCLDAFGTTDFREDLEKIDVPTLVIHGDGDGIVPFDGSGRRTHDAIEGSELVVLEGAPHGCNTSHPEEFNAALLGFLDK
jgi:pimeloyl-ACP methyl ester carboxylesterase